MMNRRDSGVMSGFAFLLGAGVGAGLMAILDPGRGAARRSFVRDKMVRGMHFAQREGRKMMMEVRNEVKGNMAEQFARMREGDIPDSQLLDRVRAQLGHVVTNFGLLQMSARDGHVTVWGPVLAGEKAKILQRLRETRGVRSCYVQVSEHESLRSISGSAGRQKPGPVEVTEQERAA